MSYCKDCGHYLTDDQIYREDISFDYAGTHCTYGRSGTHHEWGDLKSRCCDADVTDYCEDADDR